MTFYNPASNGETERFNRTITAMLRKEVDDGTHDNWEDFLGEVCVRIRGKVLDCFHDEWTFALHVR